MKRFATGLCLILILLLSACGTPKPATADDASAPSADEVTVSPKPERVLTLAMRKPETFNPLCTAYESCRETAYLFYDGLFVLTEDFHCEGNLAKTLAMSNDGLSGTLEISEGITFSDGSRLTADDVIYTVNFIKGHGGSYAACVSNIRSMEKLSDYRLWIELSVPEANLASMLTFPVIRNGSDEQMSYPVGTGQFFCGEADVSYTGLTGYARTGYHRGTPLLAGVRILYMNTDPKRESSFLSGETDVLWEKAFSERIGKMSSAVIHAKPASRWEFLGFNTETGLFSEETPRLALSAIDREALIRELPGTEKTAAKLPIHPAAWFYDADGDDGEKQTAADILERNFWRINESGVYEKDGTVMQFSILVNDDDTERLTLANQLSRLLIASGISANVESLPFDEYRERIKSGDFEAFLGGVAIGDMASPGFLFATGAPVNLFRYSGGVMDMRLSAMASAEGRALITETGKFKTVFSESVPAVSLYFRSTCLAAKSDLDIPELSPTGAFVTAYRWK